ncbi:MAG: hypothetical protein M3Y74_04945 [Chloroflexota bacterium]|nr:hypothetical protein [Chloroflexota bacterium]
MSNNPFTRASVFDAPLHPELCQEIHFAALRAATRGCLSDGVPETLPVDLYRRAVASHGPSTLLVHPDDIDRAFRGVTLELYREIDKLYCARIGRSVRMVWRILAAMADESGVPTVGYEAVWAICLYLAERRAMGADVSTERSGERWRIITVAHDVEIAGQDTTTYIYTPSVTYVLGTEPERVIAFGVAEVSGEMGVRSALYDALVAQRRPAKDGSAGLRWDLPDGVASGIDLDDECILALRDLDIAVEPAMSQTPLEHALRGDWARDLRGRTLPLHRFALLLDTYLRRLHGYGPLRIAEDDARRFAQCIGYNRDPAWQFPALRRLLPHADATIDDGTVIYDGLRYAHALLSYWSSHTITLRRSRHARTTVWVYLDGDVLCRAVARPLGNHTAVRRRVQPASKMGG